MKKIIMMMTLAMILILSSCGSDQGLEVDMVDTEESVLDSAKATREESQPSSEESAGEEGSTREEANDTSDLGDNENVERFLAPDFTLMNKEGEEVSLSDYRGKIVFLNFFTTWCTYCDQEMPDFEAASKVYSEDVEFLIVNAFTQDNVSKEGVFEWFDERNLTMELLIDEEGILKDAYPVQGFPTTFFIDREGYLLAYYPGLMSESLIDEVVSEFR
jgi:thiol-disulfide isomerase/thioredoxin